MGLFSDIGNALKNVLMMQGNLERLERNAERQDRDIADLREVMSRMSERLVRVETILDMAEMKPARRVQPKAITQEKK